MRSPIKLVVKIGSMALIRSDRNDINYNVLSRLSSELEPGMLLVSSGATEIGRLDYIRRNGVELTTGHPEEDKADYAAQGQAILINNYRQYLRPQYALRQLLVEHSHFNDEQKRDHIRQLILRAPGQKAIPIVNYNDPVSSIENMRMELAGLKANAKKVLVECVDNDETAAVIADLVKAETLLILSSVQGIYQDPQDEGTLVREVTADTPEGLEEAVAELQKSCVGASREGANGAFAKLQYVLGPAKQGTRVIIGHARYSIHDLVEGKAPRTFIGLK